MNKHFLLSKAAGLALFVICSVTLVFAGESESVLEELVFVPGGTYWRGSVEGAFAANEAAHQVQLSSFMISKYETSQALWTLVMGNNPAEFKGPNRPVERVTWFEALEFCNRLSVMRGLDPVYTIEGQRVSWDRSANGYRLPTEAEWEYAARGGPSVAALSGPSARPGFSGSLSPADVAWYAPNSQKRTWPVGGKKPNELGLHDMSGNVWEWCWDYYGTYPRSLVVDPDEPFQRTNARSIRGGAWFTPVNLIRTTNRFWSAPGVKINTIGFRIARNSDPITELEAGYSIRANGEEILSLYELLDKPGSAGETLSFD